MYLKFSTYKRINIITKESKSKAKNLHDVFDSFNRLYTCVLLLKQEKFSVVQIDLISDLVNAERNRRRTKSSSSLNWKGNTVITDGDRERKTYRKAVSPDKRVIRNNIEEIHAQRELAKLEGKDWYKDF